MTLQAKEISQLTAEDTQELFKPLGTPDLPYPSSVFVTDNKGKTSMELGVIAENPARLAAWSDRSHAYAAGQLYRRMAIPSLLHMQKEALLRRAPDSKKRVMLVLGKAGAGKSDIAKTLADVCDKRGAEVIDCGGRYLGDLLWEQVIDYGEDFKTALTTRIRAGLLSPESAQAIDKKFPKALVRNEAGKVTGINWDKTIDNKANSDEALAQSVALARTVAEYEGIPAQTTNSVGVKKVPGVFKRWHDEGRTGILDEYTKSILGSDDSLQTMLQYLNGEIDEVTTTNAVKIDGREETYSYTLRRSEMKAGFNVYLTGNDQEDGVSTHMLSKSAYSRLPLFKIEAAEPMDWMHRISQVWTGLPLSTLCTVFSSLAKDEPEEFAQTMLDLRVMGLDEKKQAAVPAHQLTLLHNWESTAPAIEKMANFYVFWSKIIDPNSDLYDDRPQNKAYQDTLQEISPAFRDECAIDFRKAIADFDDALKIKPVVRKIDGSVSLRLNFAAVSRKSAAPVSDRPEAITAELGSRLENVIHERICTMTRGRPMLQAALIKEAQERGVLTVDPSKDKETLSKLLNQDAYTRIGGIKTVAALREALVTRLKKINPWMKGKADDEIMPMDQAAAASEELTRLAKELEAQQTPRKGALVVLGKDAAGIFNRVSAVDSTGLKEKPATKDLVAISDFLESLKIPAIANMNMENIWRKTFSAENTFKASKGATPYVELAEGTHASRFGVTTLMLRADNDNEPVSAHVLADKARGRHLIVTDVEDTAMATNPGDNTVVVSRSDMQAGRKIEAFIKESMAHGSRKSIDVSALNMQLAYAFMLRAGGEDGNPTLGKLLLGKATTSNAAVYMVNKPV